VEPWYENNINDNLDTVGKGLLNIFMIATFIDITGVVLGVSNMISVVPGFISPVIVGYLTYENVSNTFSFTYLPVKCQLEVQFHISYL
jgi:hypothetical protein